jgi:hypothetical protein
MQAQEGTMKVIFAHPRDSSTYEANVAGDCTGQEAINGLVEARFIEAAGPSRAYSLKAVKSGNAIPPSQTLEAAGLKDGDNVAVLLSESGAGE